MQHHARLYLGSTETIFPHLPEEVRTPCADVHHIVRDRLLIGDVRSLITDAAQRPVSFPKRTFVLSFFDAPHEAQNALLKTLEEPTDTAEFYIIVPRKDVLMPTVLSRLMQVNIEAGETSSEMATEFFNQSYKEKTDIITAKAKEQDAAWIDAFLQSTEQLASETRNETLMRAVVLVRKYIASPGASRKMLLEYLMLSV